MKNLKHKAQSISLNTIVVAAIALIVLIVLIAIFMGRMSLTAKELDKCKGTCYETKEECSGAYQRVDESQACNLDPLGENAKGEWKIGDKYGYCCVGVS